MKVIIFLSLVYLAAAAVPHLREGSRQTRAVPEDKDRTMLELLEYYGYPAENYTVRTEDGYLLTLYRIPYGVKCGKDQPRRPPVLVQHGILSSSVDFIIAGPETGLGYILADNCYDVFLGNNRGNTQSRKHETLDPDHDGDQFWDFSWHELGKYDAPANIDKVLEVSGQPDLFWVGHSQGTTQFFVWGSMYPESHKKVRAMFALAPVAWMDHVDSLLLNLISEFSGVVGWVADWLGINEFMPSDGLIAAIGDTFCRDTVIPGTEIICENVLFLFAGFDSIETNATFLPILMGHSPAGCATKQLLHYAQLIHHSGHFRQYDYGNKENMIRYNQKDPPEYDITKIDVPVALHYGEHDSLAQKADVDQLYNRLPRVIGEFRVPFNKWNHLDFLWAIHINELLHNTLLSLMSRY